MAALLGDELLGTLLGAQRSLGGVGGWGGPRRRETPRVAHGICSSDCTTGTCGLASKQRGAEGRRARGGHPGQAGAAPV